MVIVRRIAGLLLIGAVVYAGYRLTSANAIPVDIDLIWLRFPNLPLWLALSASFALGAGVIGLLALGSISRKALTARRYRKAVNRLEAEVHQLRNLPLSAEGAEGARKAEEEARDEPPADVALVAARESAG